MKITTFKRTRTSKSGKKIVETVRRKSKGVNHIGAAKKEPVYPKPPKGVPYIFKHPTRGYAKASSGTSQAILKDFKKQGYTIDKRATAAHAKKYGKK